ncbi:MAG: HD-GYP domain-containing protein [Candidatus Omnitrophica bacterium]|nr:HD-GYP domain-containing protein [Candidatus Omnitrophota bacterium]
MVKISDIFRREDREPEEKPKGKPQEAPGLKIPKQELGQSLKGETGLGLHEEKMSKVASEVMKEKLKIEDKQKTEELYNQTIESVKEILLEGQNNKPIEVKKIKEIVGRLVDQLALGNSELVGLVRNSTSENYLYAHSTNACILSIVLGLGLNYDKKRLLDLGLAATLYDIGMIKVYDISQKPAKLTNEEYDKVKKHAIFGAEILGLLKDISRTAIYVAQEHHEWVDGKGYPKALKGEQINEYTKIISTVDIYEALTHPRAYRDKLIPFDAIRTIIRDKEHFDSHILKVLIEQIGIYPIGGWVELSSGEVGKVIRINKTNPVKPIIDIILDSQGQKLTEPKSTDLTETPNLYIKKPLEDSGIKSEI